MSKGLKVLDGLHRLTGALNNEAARLSSLADALSMSGSEALSTKLNDTALRLQELAAATNRLSNQYVSDAMGAAAASQRSVDNFILAVLEKPWPSE